MQHPGDGESYKVWWISIEIIPLNKNVKGINIDTQKHSLLHQSFEPVSCLPV